MKRYMLKKKFKNYKKGTCFYLIVESEFIGVKSFVLRPLDLSAGIEIGETEMKNYFIEIKFDRGSIK